MEHCHKPTESPIVTFDSKMRWLALALGPEPWLELAARSGSEALDARRDTEGTMTTRETLLLTPPAAPGSGRDRSLGRRLEILSRMPWLAKAAPGDVRAVEPFVRSRRYRPGELVYSVGIPADHLFCVVSGAVRLVRTSAHGRDVVTDILGPGDSFGGPGLLGHLLYPDSAQAMGRTQVLTIPADRLVEMMDRRPGLARAALEEALHRVEQTRQTIRRLSADNPQQRVAAVLMLLADKFGTEQDGALVLAPSLTRVEMAASTGLSAETVSRVMSLLRDDGIIGTGRHWTSVLDRGRLAGIAEG